MKVVPKNDDQSRSQTQYPCITYIDGKKQLIELFRLVN